MLSIIINAHIAHICIGQLKHLQKCYQRLINFDKSLTKAEILSFYKRIEVFNVAIKALEQEDVLDKIVTEIEDAGAYEQEINGKTEFVEGITYCLNIIDKYKTESED